MLLSMMLTLYFKRDQASDLWWQLELASKLESNLRDNVDWGRKSLIDFNARKTQLVSFDRSYNTGAIDVKTDGPVPEEKSSFKMLGWPSLLNWIGALALSLLLKMPPRKLELWFALWSFFLMWLLCISINLLYGLAWNTVVMSGLLLQVATWKYYISYKNGYAGLSVLLLLPLLNPWLFVEMQPA